MARWENEDLSELDIPEPEKVERLYFGKTGEESNEKDAFASLYRVDKSESYYILYDRAEIIDPYNQRVAKSTIATRGFRKVCSLSFDFYMKYLKTRNNLYFTRARRLVMEK
tara:strand:- start:330 stop:662 length:333 start_codon:yes stop_codon:yes gene_type:complete